MSPTDNTFRTFSVDGAKRPVHLDVKTALTPTQFHSGRAPDFSKLEEDGSTSPVIYLWMAVLPMQAMLMAPLFGFLYEKKQITFAFDPDQAAAVLAQMRYASERAGTLPYVEDQAAKMYDALQTELAMAQAARETVAEEKEQAPPVDPYVKVTCPICFAETYVRRPEQPEGTDPWDAEKALNAEIEATRERHYERSSNCRP